MKTLKLGLLSIIIIIIGSTKSFSQKIVVTTGTDSISGSLREAVINAQSGDTVIFDESLSEIILGEKINIDKSLTIIGNPILVIRGRGAGLHFPRVFEIAGELPITVNIDSCNLFKTGFHIGDTVSYNTDGGVILISNANSIVNINNCYFTAYGSYGGNVHYYQEIKNGQNGGAIANYGCELNISNSTFSDLKSGGSVYTGGGGAIFQLSGKLNLVNCTFYSNSVWHDFSANRPFIGLGSAIFTQNCTLDVTNCTFCEHNNHYYYFRPAPEYGSVTISTSTISLNNSNLLIKNSIFYKDDNRDLAGNSNSTFTSGGYNIFDQTISTDAGASPTDMFNVNPGFNLVGVNGYTALDKSFWIPVCALNAAGSAIDGLPADGNGAPTLDQRGHRRINTPDIGAFEFESCIPTDMRAKWNPSKFGQSSWADDISVVNDSVIWVKDAGSDSISITNDRGSTWKSKSLPVIQGLLNPAGGICAVSQSKAYYILSLSDAKGVYVTSDTAKTWTRQSTAFNESASFPNFIYFWNDNQGITIGDAIPNFEIYVTNNGGIQWNRIADANMPGGNNEATYNTQESFRVNGGTFNFLTSSARIFRSVDYGSNWTVINTPFQNARDSTISFDFKDDNNGLISYCSNDEQHRKMFKTINGGQTWDSISTTNYYQKIKYIPALEAYCSMNINGGLSYSCDDGKTWISVSNFNNIELISAGFSSSGKLFLGGLGYIFYSSPILNVTESELTISAPANSTSTFDILSNTNWNVVSNQNWLSVSSANGSGNSTVTLTATENQNSEERLATITVSGAGVGNQSITVKQNFGTTGTNVIRKNLVSMFPNPVTNEITIYDLGVDAVVLIYNLNGNLLINRTAGSTNMKIDLSHLVGGIYLIEVIDNKAIKTGKLIKQ